MSLTDDIKSAIKTHVWYLVLIGIGLLAGHSWLQEHDARLKAEETAKVEQQKFQDFQKQIDAVNAASAAKVAVLQKQAAEVKTPSQAIAAIPDVSSLPLHVAPIPSMPTAVQVEAVPLYQELAACQIDRVKLDACVQSQAIKDKQIESQKQTISALKQPTGFWHRFATAMKYVGVGIGVGAIIGAHL